MIDLACVSFAAIHGIKTSKAPSNGKVPVAA